MSILTKIFGTYSDRQVKKLLPTIDKVEALSDKYKSMTDEVLKQQTDVLKQRLQNGETLDDILPDAFATVREASTRVLGKRHYRVQLIGGMIIHQGRIAEMKTGEGKTLVATLPAYLNALSGNGVHIVTVNDYLATRDSEWMGKVYRYLGLSVGLIVNGLDTEQRQAAYNADITYGTNNEFGFDYLRDNMMIYKRQVVQRGHNFAIVDEVDSILIDEARTPLIISGQSDENTDLYEQVDRFVRRLKVYRIKEMDTKINQDEISGDADYIVDEKARTAVLTSRGVQKAEQHFKVDNLADAENSELSHHITQSIRAHGTMRLDVDYVVKDNQVLIVDSFTGRIMIGRRFNNGLHQAIEAKEGVKVESENKTQATITFQNYFRLYKKLSGMTGTALTEDEEFRDIYALDVVEIPTNKPMIRIDKNDCVYTTAEGKYNAVIQRIIECSQRKQPVLVGTVSIEKSVMLSQMLKKQGIAHTVLNAKFHEKEAEIIAQAGKLGAVTISTNMAGRGTDIMLGGNSEYMAKNQMRSEGYDDRLIYESTAYGDTNDEDIIQARSRFKELEAEYSKVTSAEAEEVKRAGGLYIIGTERHESRRIDNQLRGRSGRQGDPGESCFFLSFEDDLLRLFGAERIQGLVSKFPADQAMDLKLVSNAIENAQKNIEGRNFERRKNVLQYDDVMNQQRELIYKQRREVLDGKDVSAQIKKMISDYIDEALGIFLTGDVADDWNFEGLRGNFAGTLCTDDDFKYSADELNSVTREKIRDMLMERADALYAEKEKLFTPEVFREVERTVLLRNVDEKWRDHIDAMDDLESGMGLRSYAQKNPVVEYKIEGSAMFEEMIAQIREDTVKLLFRLIPGNKPVARKQVLTGTEQMKGDGTVKRQIPQRRTVEKIGPNDLCPCGSGKKYKKCCGSVAGGQK